MSAGAIGFVSIPHSIVIKDNPMQPEMVRYDNFVKEINGTGTTATDFLDTSSRLIDAAAAITRTLARFHCDPRVIPVVYVKKELIDFLGDLRFAMQDVMNTYDIDEQTVLQYSAIKRMDSFHGCTVTTAKRKT